MTTATLAAEPFTIHEEIFVRASLEKTFRSLLANMGRLNQTPDGNDSSPHHDSTHMSKPYSSPSSRPGKVACAPSAVGTHRWPSGTIPNRSDDPSPL